GDAASERVDSAGADGGVVERRPIRAVVQEAEGLAGAGHVRPTDCRAGNAVCSGPPGCRGSWVVERPPSRSVIEEAVIDAGGVKKTADDAVAVDGVGGGPATPRQRVVDGRKGDDRRGGHCSDPNQERRKHEAG